MDHVLDQDIVVGFEWVNSQDLLSLLLLAAVHECLEQRDEVEEYQAVRRQSDAGPQLGAVLLATLVQHSDRLSVDILVHEELS